MDFYWIYSQPNTLWLSALALILWTTFWHLISGWYAAKQKNKKWYLAIMILPSIGIIPIVYLLRHCRCEK